MFQPLRAAREMSSDRAGSRMTAEQDGEESSPRPSPIVVSAATVAVAVLSFAYLDVLTGAASTLLAFLMISGAEVDARVFLIPNFVSYGAIVSGLAAAFILNPADPWHSLAYAILRAAGLTIFLLILRAAYKYVRHKEGLGLGDVKLAAAIGAWLPFEAIPTCFSVASTAALIVILFNRRTYLVENQKLPFGAFLCPALWLSFFVTSLHR